MLEDPVPLFQRQFFIGGPEMKRVPSNGVLFADEMVVITNELFHEIKVPISDGTMDP